MSKAALADLVEKAMTCRRIRCPWNPFPLNSEWGRILDDMYTKDISRRAQQESTDA